MEIEIYTDGGCHGNPGPGAWAFVLVGSDGNAVSRAGTEQATTNNRMELLAVIKALEEIDPHLAAKADITIHTDSQYVQKGITQWITGWEKNGWLTASKKPVKNKELWQELKRAAERFTIRWKWVQGHAGDTMNELCDTLVQRVLKHGLLDR
jgi:ribonuclease HI